MAKKGFFRTAKAFSCAAAIFAGTLGAAFFGAVFSSCENLNDVSSRIVLIPEAQGHSNGGQSAGGSSGAAGASSIENCLTASVSLPGLPSLAGIAPLPKNVARYAAQSGASDPAAQSGASQDSALDGVQKSAFPNIADAANTAYSFSATLAQTGAGGATYSADGTYNSVTGPCSFVFAGAKSAAAASYTLTVNLFHTGGTPAVKSLVASGSQGVSVAAGGTAFDASVSLAPNLESGAPNGSLLLPIKFSDTSVTSVHLTLLDSGNYDVTASCLACGTSLTLTGGTGTIESVTGGLPAGTYTLLMSFMKGTAQVGARTESLNVYPAMETKLWWTKDGIGAAAAALSVMQFNQKEFYVRGTGGVFYTTVFPTAAEAEDTNSGSFAFPLKTIQEAVDRIKAAGDTTSQYTIYVDGKVTGAADADCSAQNDACVNIACDRMITIKGWSGANIDIIDANKSSAKNARVFYIESSKKIILQKIAVTGGYLSATSPATAYGGGLYISGATTEVELEDCVIKENGAQNQGAGAYIASGAKLTMNGSGSAINKNMLLATTGYASDTYEKKVCGGGVYVAQSATFTMNDGIIRENFAVVNVDTTSAAGVFSGCAAYVCGTFTMKGGTIASNGIRLATSSPIKYCRNVEVTCPGTFDLYDGSITDDMDLLPCNNGSGVCVYAASYTSPVTSGVVTFNMYGGTISGHKSQNGGAVYLYASSGTGLSCEFNMSGGSIIGNEAKDSSYGTNGQGGGVFVGRNSVFNFTGGTISGNTATPYSGVTESGLGGGIYIAATSGTNSAGQCYISGSATIGQSLASTSSCATSADGSHSNMAVNGGGIYNKGELYLGYTDDSTPAAWTGSVCYNYASSDGGGILSSGSSSLVKMNAGSVAYNLCSDGSGTTGGGGGVAVQNSSAFTMSGGTVSYNQTNNKVGGGIYVDSGARLTLSGTAEVSSNKTSPDGTGSMGGAGLFAYRAAITMEGNAVVKDNLCKACGGGVYLFEFESASSYASLAMSGNAKILENTSSDGLGGAVYVTQRCSFSMSGAATIPAGVAGTTGAGKNDVYLDVNTSVAVPAAITSTTTPVATITPKSPYAVNTTVLTGAALTAAECAKFAVTQPGVEEFPWVIKYDSGTAKGVLKQPLSVIYVAAESAGGSDATGTGSSAAPYATIQEAAKHFTDKTPAIGGTADEPIFENKIYVLSNMTFTGGAGVDNNAYYFEIVGCKGGTVGSNVTLTFNTPTASGFYVAYGQKIKLTHIDITQSSATANNYATILVENSSTNGVGELWMEDSSIKNMYAKSCSAIAAKGDVHLKNVEISGNKTVANTSGATPFGPAINSTTGTVSVLGKLVIKDNQMQINTAAAGDPPSYVYKDQNLWIGENAGTPVFHPIRIAGALDGESDIGVTLFDYGTLYTTFTSGFASAGISAPSDVFASDDGMSVIKNISSGEAIMTAPTSLYVSQTGSDLIGNGSRLAPFATINKAISTINALDASGISYTIYVRGTVKGYAEIPDGVKAAKITIDKEPSSLVTNTLDGVGKASPVLTINAAIPVDISNLTITRGSRGVDIEEAATVKITDCVVTGNGGSVTGAGIYVRKGSVDISGTEISGNTTSSNGGGLYVESSGVTGFTMTGGAITGNSAGSGGGADINCQKGANPLMDGVTISGNTASAGNGGGIFVTSGMYLGIKDCVISGNTAGTASVSGHGGGIYNAGTCYIYGSTVIGDAGAGEAAKLDDGKHSNLATGYGGGIYNAKNLYLGYSDYTATSNAPEPLTGGVYYNFAGRGGAIYTASSTQTVVASGTYKYNSVPSSSGGGAIFNAGTLTMHDGLIDGNVACLGGGVYVSGSGSFTMNDGTISDNYANESDACGGGGVLVAGAFAMNSGAISGNHGYLGGGVYVSGDSSMSGGTISGNDAVSGGGVYIAENKFTMTGGIIEENTATTNGGGVDVHNDGTSVGTLELGDNAYIPLGTTNNDVYLGNAISLVSSLDKAAPVVTITPSVYGTTGPVLTEATPGLVGGNYDKFAVTPDGSDAWSIDQYGYLSQSASSGGSVTIYTPDGQLGLSVNTTEVTTSASATSISVSAKNASGVDISASADISGWTLDWYYGSSSEPIVSSSGRTFSFPKTYPKGTYRLTVSVTYKGTTYSDTFTIKKTVEGYVAQPNVFDGEATLCADDADRKSSVFIKDRSITISATLWACDHETTQGEYETYCFYGGGSSNEPSDTYGKGTNYPAYYVSWYDAIVYCNLRSIAEGKTACYKLGSESNPKNWSGIVAGTGANAGKYCGPSSDNSVWNGITCDFEASGYRLPTQAEWEYLARGKNLTNDGQTIYSGSDIADDVVWHSGNASGKSHEVGGLAANDAGLYDMCGNVWEWCWDWTGAINASTPATGNSSGVYRRYLGGSWNFAASTAKICSSSSSYSYARNYFTGFRVVRNAP
ncbi:MAG: SUMF1/EgtB/PvdO family nonheme iron enzyme [Treponema sp.]|nr:SUMF1/EgtB/PvdO family nonheme iron enzyme [Treponema sp.]